MLKELLPYINDIKEDVRDAKKELTQLNKTVSHLSGDLKRIERGIDTTSESMRGDISSVERELSSLDESMKRLNDKIEDNVASEIQNLTCVPQEIVICDGTEGWRRVVNLDMMNPNTDCPEGWSETVYSKSRRTCGRATDDYYTCDSVTFSVSGGEYTQVCGRIKAYQWGQTQGFRGYNRGHTSINDSYFSGVGVMHGSPRQHIWSFAAGSMKKNPYPGDNRCPCDTTYNVSIPPFVGEDYICGSGYTYTDPQFSGAYSFHSNDTLWDGKDCRSGGSRPNPPYFTKTLDTSTSDDIELRMCNYYNKLNENIAVELIELYVK